MLNCASNWANYQMHQIILVNLGDIPDITSSQAQPVLYYLSLAIVGSGIGVALWSLFNFLSTSKEQVFLIVIGILFLTIVFAAQVTLAFFAVSFHLRAHEDLREELLARLQNQYNEIGGEFFSPALDFVQTKVNKNFYHLCKPLLIHSFICSFSAVA